MHLKGYKYGPKYSSSSFKLFNSRPDWFKVAQTIFWTVLDQVAVLVFQLGSDLSHFLDHCTWTGKPLMQFALM